MSWQKSDEIAVEIYLRIIRAKYEFNITERAAAIRCSFKPTSMPNLKRRITKIIARYSLPLLVEANKANQPRFKIAGAVVLEDLQLRHVSETVKLPNGIYVVVEKMYHSCTMGPFGEKYLTKDCDSPDESGYCRGHLISREDFLIKYCNGEDPPLFEPHLNYRRKKE